MSFAEPAPCLPATVAVLPDTQIIAAEHPQLYDVIADWVIDHADQFGIAAVLHVGDVVDSGAADPAQQRVARMAHDRIVAAGLPLFVAPGNHDYDNLVDTPGRPLSAFAAELSTRRYADQPWFGHSWDGDGANCWGTITLAGRQHLVLVLEFGPRPEAVDWAAGVIAEQDLPTIVLTHCYLTAAGELMHPGVIYHPRDSPGSADGLDGVELWQRLRLLPQMRMVLCGHHVPMNLAHRVDLNDAGRGVFASFQNFQLRPQGGQGRIRLIDWTDPERLRLGLVNPTTGEFETGPGRDDLVDLAVPGLILAPAPPETL